MTKATDTKRQVAENINQPKSALIHELKKLEQTSGCTVAARQLESVIAKLEAWQMAHRK